MRKHIDRRTFLRYAAIGGTMGMAARPTEAWAAEAAARPGKSAANLVALEEATIDGLQEEMKAGSLTARRLTQAYLDRIDALDRKGPALRSVIETNPEALAIAESLDAERKLKGPRGPLHGIPVLLKDNLDTADRMTTTAGSLALAGSIPVRDSFVAERLREAGAVLLGKANLSEWANIRSAHSSSGWSGRGGQCRNPYALDRNPCGSSSGSGSAVSANLCAAAIGTETDGSIVCPSNANGLVGIKPTLGLVSRAGIIPIAHSQDTAGPMARTVRDAAILLAAIAGPDPRDAATADAGRAPRDYTTFLDDAGLRGARIGVARKFFGFHAGVDRILEEALAEMKRRGALLVDPADIPHTGEYDESELTVLLYELKADLNAYLASLGPKAPVRTLADVIAFNEAHRAEEMPYFGQDLFVKAQAKGPLTDLAYIEALARNRRLAALEGIDAVMNQQKLDAIVAPTGGRLG
jgi:amidase